MCVNKLEFVYNELKWKLFLPILLAKQYDVGKHYK